MNKASLNIGVNLRTGHSLISTPIVAYQVTSTLIVVITITHTFTKQYCVTKDSRKGNVGEYQEANLSCSHHLEDFPLPVGDQSTKVKTFGSDFLSLYVSSS